MEIECVCVYIFLGGEDDMMIYVLCHVNVEKMCRFAKKNQQKPPPHGDSRLNLIPFFVTLGWSFFSHLKGVTF